MTGPDITQTFLLNAMMATQHYGDIDNLPPELLDQIILENNHDLQSIRSTSLVSKAWRAVSLRYLFSTAEFCSESDCHRWNTIAESMPHVLTYVSKATYAPGMREERRTMNALNAKFTAGTPEYYAAFVEIFRQGREATVTLPAILPDIPTMPSVSRFVWSTPPYLEPGAVQFSPTMERFFRAFPAVTEVSISSVALSIDDAHMILNAFASTKILTWKNGLRMPPPGEVYAPFLGHLSDLQELRLWGGSDAPLLDWLGRALVDSPLRRICLYHTTPISIEGLMRVLKGASDTLIELELTSDLVDRVRVTPNLNLNLGVLRSVRIESIWYPLQVRGSEQGEMDVIASMLTSLCESASCPLLSFIDLQFCVDDNPIGDLFSSWKTLAHTISRRLPSFRDFHIVFLLEVVPASEEHWQEVVVNSVKDGMPDLASKITVSWRRK